MDTLSAALDFNYQGIACIPIKPASKLPTIAWREYQNRAPEFGDLISWFSEGDKNIAVLCGLVSNSLVILDFDTLQAYEEWRSNYPGYADSFSVSTSRGRHVYLFADDLPERTFKSGECDVKVTGYCLTVPSIHPSGTQYQVVNEAPIKRVSGLSEVGMTPSICGTSQPIVINNYGTIHTLNVTTCSNTNTRRQSSTISRIKELVSITDLFPNFYPSGDGKGMSHCPMPAHQNGDRNPSLSLDLITNRAQCLKPGCQLHTRHGGDVIDCFAILHKLTTRQAIAMMASELGF